MCFCQGQHDYSVSDPLTSHQVGPLHPSPTQLAPGLHTCKLPLGGTRLPPPMPSLPGLVELGVGGEGRHPRGLQGTQPLSSTHDGTGTFLVSMKITHAPHLPNILIFLTFSRRGSQQAVVKEHKRSVTRYCIYPDPISQMAMCSFLHLLTHSFIHSFSIAVCSIYQSCSVASNSVTPLTVTYQASLSMEYSRQEHWSALPCPLPGDLSDSGIEPTSLASPASAGGFFTSCSIIR